MHGTRRSTGSAGGLAGTTIITVMCATLIFATVMFATGCTAHSTTVGSGIPGAGTNTSTPGSPIVSFSPAATGASPVSATRPSATAADECSADVLRITAISGGGAGGHEGEILRFTDVGTATCFIGGYPGVAELDRQDHLIQNAVRSPNGYLGGLGTPRDAPRVTLHPGDTATALAEAVDNFPVPGYPTCVGANATHLLVTAPDQTAATSLPVLLSACNAFQIHPITASANGSEP